MSSSDVGGELRGSEQPVQSLVSADETRLAGRGGLVVSRASSLSVIYACGSAVRSVVVPGREDDDLCFGDDVHQSVLVVDPPGPRPGQVVLERLGLADAGERISPD